MQIFEENWNNQEKTHREATSKDIQHEREVIKFT